MVADFALKISNPFLFSGMEMRILKKCFHHVIMEFLGVHSFDMKVFDNSFDFFFFVHCSDYCLPIRIKVVSYAYINTADQSDLVDKVLRARRNEEEMRMKPATSFKLFTIFSNNKTLDNVQNRKKN